MRIYKLQNVTTALECLERHQVKLVGVTSDHIVDGNKKLILGLVATLIHHFKLSSDSDDKVDIHSPLCSFSLSQDRLSSCMWQSCMWLQYIMLFHILLVYHNCICCTYLIVVWGPCKSSVIPFSLLSGNCRPCLEREPPWRLVLTFQPQIHCQTGRKVGVCPLQASRNVHVYVCM